MSPLHLIFVAAPSALPGPVAAALRSLLARALQSASDLLHSLAVQLAVAAEAAPPASLDEPVLEYHADAGAPEGALYIDGELVGHLEGVVRL